MDSNPTVEKTESSFWKELVKLAVIAVVVVIPFRLFIAQPFVVEGASMDPTFSSGEYLIVDEVSYNFQSPARGSVVIFKYPLNPKKYFIKRIIGLPGEEVRISNGEVTIINTEHPNGLKIDEPYVKHSKVDDLNFNLGKNEYFVMGDNRAGSADSRLWGPVPAKNIVGRPVFRLWPPAIWPGKVELTQDEDEKN